MEMIERLGFFLLLMMVVVATPALAQSDEGFAWPEGAQVAISLSYDDALHSQLDHAIPALDEHAFKGSFYLTLSAEAIRTRMEEWRAAAANGHELGNHTIYHPCRASLPNREWVIPEHDLDQFSVLHMQEEVVTANTFLHALDGETERTFTVPCGDMLAGGENYVVTVESLFVALKGQEVASGFASLWAPADVSDGAALINYVEEQAQSKKLINLLFHGVGGDYLSVSDDAHRMLLQYLADNRDRYWVDSYINIMKHVAAQRATTH